jgi:hypothetical protein
MPSLDIVGNKEKQKTAGNWLKTAIQSDWISRI